MKSNFHSVPGIGLGLRKEFFDKFLSSTPAPVNWVEVITENYIDWHSQPIFEPLRRLKLVREHCPVVLHGVSLSLGSRASQDNEFIKRLKRLIEEIEPLWVSDHLCWSRSKTHNLHDLFPLPFTEEAIVRVVEEIQRIQESLQRPFVIENVSAYLNYSQSVMSEWEFISEILRRSGAKLLLDINNVYVNAFNFKFDPRTYLQNLPHGAVVQIHLAGHSDEGDYLFDTHDAPVCDPVWTLYEWYVSRYGFVPTLIERDDAIPPWDSLVTELYTIERIRDRHAPAKLRPSSEVVC